MAVTENIKKVSLDCSAGLVQHEIREPGTAIVVLQSPETAKVSINSKFSEEIPVQDIEGVYFPDQFEKLFISCAPNPTMLELLILRGGVYVDANVNNRQLIKAFLNLPLLIQCTAGGGNDFDYVELDGTSSCLFTRVSGYPAVKSFRVEGDLSKWKIKTCIEPIPTMFGGYREEKYYPVKLAQDSNVMLICRSVTFEPQPGAAAIKVYVEYIITQ